jgi:soluble lytic murein transglycosylase-like protein
MADFQGSATSTAFAPVRAVDQTPDMKEQLQQRLGWMREDNQATISNRNDVAAGMAEVNRFKQRTTANNLEELGQFSKSISNLLLEQKKARDEDQFNEGFHSYWIGEGDQKEIDRYREGEAQLAAADKVVNGVAFAAAQAGEPPRAVSAIRNLSGKKKVGYLTAMAQDKGRGYSSWLDQKIATDDQTAIKLGNITVTPKDAQRDESLLAGVTAALRLRYIRENGLDGASYGLLNEHLIPSMREGEAKVVGKYSQAILIDRASGEIDEASSIFISSIKSGTPDLNSLVSTLQSVINPETRTVYGRSGAIDKAFELLAQLGKDGIEGGLTPEMIDALKLSPDLDGKNTWGGRHANRFIGLTDTIRSGNQADNNAREAALAEEGKAFANDLYQGIIQKGGITDAEYEAMDIEWRSRFEGPLPEKLASLKSIEKRTAEESRKYVIRKLANGEPISEKDLLGLDDETRLQFRDKITANKQNFVENDDSKANIKSLESALKLNLDIQDIGQTTDPTYDLAANRAKRQYIGMVQQLIAGGIDPGAAHLKAYEHVKTEIERGKATSGGDGQPMKPGSGLYRLETIGGRKGFVEFLVGGKSRDSIMAAERQLAGVRASLNGGGKAVLWSKKLLSDSDLAAIEELRTDPSAPIPASVLYLARNTGLSEWDVMDQQLKFLKKPPLTKPPKEQFADSIDPNFQRLLKSRPSARRTARAFSGVPWSPEKVPKGWGKLIEQAAAANGLDPALLAGMLDQESSWDPRNVSPTGHKGLGQFGAAAAQEMGLKDPFNPVEAIPAAARYLKKSIDAFGGDLRLGLRAYNQGIAGTQRFPNGGSKEATEYPDLVLKKALIYGYGQTGGGSPYAQPGLMNPRLVYRIESRGYGSTGPHLDVKPVVQGTLKGDRNQRYVKGTLDNFVSVKVGGKLQPLSKGTTTTDDDAAHRARRRSSFGHDYAAPSGTELYLRNGAKVVGTFKGDGGTDHTIIQLPDGRRFQFLHGTNA